MLTYQGEPIARAIRQHQVEESNMWPYRRLVAELHTFADCFDRDFDLRVPVPIIAVDRLRRNTIACYRLDRNEIGARAEITFNARWLPKRSFMETCATLVHEQCHEWEEFHCGRERGGWYHTKAWRDKMEQIGITADDHGLHQHEGRFFVYLRRTHSLPDIRDLLPGAEPALRTPGPPPRQRHLFKWLCACEKASPVRATMLNARCHRCGFDFVKVAD